MHVIQNNFPHSESELNVTLFLDFCQVFNLKKRNIHSGKTR